MHKYFLLKNENKIKFFYDKCRVLQSLLIKYQLNSFLQEIDLEKEINIRLLQLYHFLKNSINGKQLKNGHKYSNKENNEK